MISPQMDQAQDQVQIPQLVGPPGLDGIDPTFGFQSPPPPEVRLAQMKADAKAKVQETNRRKDSVALPAIQEDLAKGTLHQQQLEASIAETQKLIQSIAMPQYQQGQLSMGDNIGAALSGIFGGAQGFNQAAGGAYERADQMAGQRYKEAGMQYQQEREDAQNTLEAKYRELDNQSKLIQQLKMKSLEALMSEDEANRGDARENLKAALEMEQLLQQQRGAIDLEKEKQKGKVDLKKVDTFVKLFDKMDPASRDELATAMGISDDPSFKEAVQKLSVAEQEKAQRTKNLAQAFDYHTKADPVRIKVMEAQEKALLSMVPLRDAQTQHTLADIERIRSIVTMNNTRTALLDDEFKLQMDEFLFKKSQAELAGATDNAATTGALNLYGSQIKKWESEIAQKQAEGAAEVAKRTQKDTMTVREAEIADEIVNLRKRIEWATQKKVELEATNATKSAAQFSGARAGGLTGKIDKSGKLPAKKSNPYAPVQVSPDMGNTGSVGTTKRKEGKNPFEDLGGKVKG